MVWYFGALLAAMLLLGFALWGYLAVALKVDKEKTLRSRADRIGDALGRHSAAVGYGLRQGDLDAILSTMPEGSMVRIISYDRSGNITSSQTLSGSSMPSVPALAGYGWLVHRATRYRTLTEDRNILGTHITLVLGSQYEENFRFLNHILLGLLSVGPVVLLASWGGYVLSGRALRPMRDLAAAAASITLSDLTGRLPVPNTGDELQTIAESFDALLRRLVQAMRRQQRFTADASHDLRTPLAIVRTTAEVALRYNDAKQTRQALEEVLVECVEMERILDDLLLLARLEGADPNLAPVNTPILTLLVALSDRLAPFAEERGLHFHRHFAVGPQLCICIDPKAFSRAIGALLDNAIHYTRAGGRVEFKAELVGEEIVCTLKDTGIGIAEVVLPHIFERFFRADPARSIHTGGTGLGLAIAKWTIESYKGRIAVKSQEGTGTEITVTLPIAEPAPS